jgi:hypothetical protein
MYLVLPQFHRPHRHLGPTPRVPTSSSAPRALPQRRALWAPCPAPAQHSLIYLPIDPSAHAATVPT